MRKILFCVLLLGVCFVAGAEYNRIGDLELPETGFVMRSEALAAIEDSEEMINRMRDSNFSVVKVSEDLVKAKEVFQMVDYSEILRDSGATAEARWEAIKAIGEIDWRYLEYGDVLDYTDDIMATVEKAFLSYESLVLARVVYEECLDRGEIVDDALIERAEGAFYEERYDEASNFALMAKELAEEGFPKVSFWDRVGDFFGAYWIYVLVLMIFVVAFFHKKIVGVFRRG